MLKIFVVLLATAATTLTATAGQQYKYKAYQKDPYGIQALKAGHLKPQRTWGECAPGFAVVPGKPGDPTCFWINDGATLRCPNTCQPAK